MCREISHEGGLILDEMDIRSDGRGEGSEWVITESTDSTILTRSLPVEEKLVPNVVQMGMKDAIFLLEGAGLKVRVKGYGTVRSQSIRPGTLIRPGQSIVLEMSFG